MELWRRLGLAAVLAVALVGAGTQVRAQETLFDRTLRIGVVLPERADPGAAPLAAAVRRSAEEGVLFAEEEFAFNAELLGFEFAVATETPTGGDVVAAARKLVDQGAFAIMGGFSLKEANALGVWAKASGIPFINIGASADVLRNDQCYSTTYHLEPSAAMYLDALVGWYVRSGLRQWYFVTEDTDEGRAQYERVRWSMRERHFGAREVGRMALAPGRSGGAALATAVGRSGADVVVLLQSAVDQVRTLRELEAGGIGAPIQVTGFPYPEAQTRAFFAASKDAAPILGTGHRATAWEASIDAYGGREYNARYLLRWNAPMESTAWAIYHGVKALYESAFFGGSMEAKNVLAYLSGAQTVLDLHKGIGSSFRPWDRQLRQSLYLVKINGRATTATGLGLLVGELPAIYLPGTELIERLDQLGDLKAQSRCRQ